MKPRELIPLSVLLLFMLLVAGSILHAKPRIEHELGIAVREKIEALRYGNITAVINGRDAMFSGTVENANRLQELRDAVESHYGIRVADLTDVSVIAAGDFASDSSSSPPTVATRSDGLIFLAVQVLGFLVIALLLGFLLGWSLFSAMPNAASPKKKTAETADTSAAEVEKLRAELDTARAEIEPLRNAVADANLLANQWAEAARKAGEERDAAQIAAAESESAGEDDLTRLKGVGPVLVEQLREHGVIEFRQIADWGKAEIDFFTGELRGLKLAFARFDIVKEARELMEEA